MTIKIFKQNLLNKGIDLISIKRITVRGNTGKEVVYSNIENKQKNRKTFFYTPLKNILNQI